MRGDEVVIERLAVEDRTLVELIERRHAREIAAAETVANALEIGARVLDREATGAEVDAIRRELERASAEAEHAFAERARRIGEGLEQQFERFLGEDGGAMAKVLDSHADEVAELIAKNFGGDRNTAVQHQVKDIVAKALTESRQDLLRQFSAQDGHNPLADFKASIVREVKRTGESNEKLIEKIALLEGEVKLLHADARPSSSCRPSASAAPARAGRSSSRPSSWWRSCRCARRRRAPCRRCALSQRRQEGRHRDRDRRVPPGRRRGASRSMPRMSACRRTALGDAQRRARRARCGLRDPAGRLRREGAGRPAAAAGVRGQQDDRDPRQGDFGRARLELAYRYARCRCLMAAERTSRSTPRACATRRRRRCPR